MYNTAESLISAFHKQQGTHVNMMIFYGTHNDTVNDNDKYRLHDRPTLYMVGQRQPACQRL